MPTALDAYDQVERTGCRVFPIPLGSKKPNIPDWRNAASNQALRVGEMFHGGNYNIGTVVDDHLVVLDADEAKSPGAIAHLHQLLLDHGLDAETLMRFRTASGGEHVPLRVPYAIATKIRQWGHEYGVDVIGFGSQFIAAPSLVRYPDGTEGVYSVINDGVPIPDCPPSLLNLLVRYEDRKARVSTGDVQELDNVADVLGFKGVIAATKPAIEGQGGNDHTYRLACEGRDCGLSEDTVIACIFRSQWNADCLPPWSYEELSELVANAFRYGRSSQGSKSVGSLFNGVNIPPPIYTNGHTPPPNLPPPPMNPGTGPAYVPLPDDWIKSPSTDKSDRPWIVYDLLERQQVTAMAAHGGTGKGMMLVGVAVRLIVGGNYGPWLFKGGERVVILSYEEDERMIGHKIMGQIEHYGLHAPTIYDNLAIVDMEAASAVQLTRTTRDGTVVIQEAVDDLVTRLQKFRATVLFVDPLQFIGTGDMNLGNVAGPLMKAIWAVTRRANVAFCYMHHIAKGDKSVSLRGSSVLHNNTRLIHSLERSEEFEGHNVIDVSMNKTNLGEFDKRHYFFEIIRHQLTPSLSTGVMVDSQHASQQISKNKRAIRECVAARLASGEGCEGGTLPGKAIRDWLKLERGISDDTAWRAIKAEFKLDVATIMPDGHYITLKKKPGGVYFFAYSDDDEIAANAVKFNRPPDKIEDLI